MPSNDKGTTYRPEIVENSVSKWDQCEFTRICENINTTYVMRMSVFHILLRRIGLRTATESVQRGVVEMQYCRLLPPVSQKKKKF